MVDRRQNSHFIFQDIAPKIVIVHCSVHSETPTVNLLTILFFCNAIYMIYEIAFVNIYCKVIHIIFNELLF